MTAIWQRPKCESVNCVEVKVEQTRVYLRSSSSNQLVTLTLDEWNVLRVAIKNGEFDA